MWEKWIAKCDKQIATKWQHHVRNATHREGRSYGQIAIHASPEAQTCFRRMFEEPVFPEAVDGYNTCATLHRQLDESLSWVQVKCINVIARSEAYFLYAADEQCDMISGIENSPEHGPARRHESNCAEDVSEDRHYHQCIGDTEKYV